MGKRTSEIEVKSEQVVNAPDVLALELKDDGIFPNSKLPLLLYRGAVLIPEHDPAAALEQLFESNGWVDSWRDGIYAYHH